MRVLLDISPLHGPASGRGIGRWVTALDSALRTVGDVTTYEVTTGHGRLGELWELPGRQRAQGAPHDLLVTPTAYSSPLRSRTPWIASVLDVIPLELAEHRKTGAKAQLFHRLSARAEVLLTLSEHAAGRIHELLGVPRERIVVAPLPVALGVTGGVLPAGLAPGGYIASLADLATPDPRKRLNWLPQVATLLDVPLVVVGAGTKGAWPGVRGLGRVDDATWAAVLREAGAFLYTSSYEGQGLPPLEAMAEGAPVVAMDNTAVAEVVAGAGVLVPEGPGAIAALAQACARLLADPLAAQQLREAGWERAQAFSTQAFTERVAAAVALATS